MKIPLPVATCYNHNQAMIHLEKKYNLPAKMINSFIKKCFKIPDKNCKLLINKIMTIKVKKLTESKARHIGKLFIK